MPYEIVACAAENGGIDHLKHGYLITIKLANLNSTKSTTINKLNAKPWSLFKARARFKVPQNGRFDQHDS
jgi:hypothetical protein